MFFFQRYPEVSATVPHGTLNVRAFKHSLPQQNISSAYFTTRPASDNAWGLSQDFSDESDGNGGVRTKPVLCIGMSFYNEEPHEIRRTLVSIGIYFLFFNENLTTI